MKQVDYLIKGQGVAGTFLSWYLHRQGKTFVVIDDADPSASSRIAAGVINPVTGRRIVKTWMIDTLLPFVLDAYSTIGSDLEITAIHQKNIIDFFPSPQMLLAFRDRVAEGADYLSLAANENRFAPHFHYDFGWGEISPAYVVQLQELLGAWRRRLQEQGSFSEEKITDSELVINKNGVQYGSWQAEKIIFCDGIRSSVSPWFRNLPFALNKGEALVIRAGELPSENIFKKGISLVPLQGEYFWAGSSHEWNFTDAEPGNAFREKTQALLQQWLKVPFTIEAHYAALRPATIERRPFVGLHPHYPQIGILNGMGTKGCSLAPYFANQLANHLTKNNPILPEASVNRFTRLLLDHS